MTPRRLIIVVLFAFSVAVLLLFVRLSSVLEHIAVSKLEGLGATGVRLELADVGLKATQLGELSFVFEQSARRYTISSQDIGVSYVLSDLLSGNLDTVNVPEISVLIERLPSSEEASQTSIPSPSDWLTSIPFKHFNLGHLKLGLPDEKGRTRNIEVNGKLNIVAASADARFDIQTNDYGTQRLELKLTPAGQSQLVLSDLQTPATPVTYIALTSGAWASADGKLQADVGIDIDIQKVQQQLQRWAIQIIPKGASGSVTAQGPLRVSLNNSSSWQPKGTLALQIPTLNNIGKQLMLKAPFEMALTNEQLQWSVGKASQLSLKNVRFGETRIKSVASKLATQANCGYQFEKSDWTCEPFALELDVPSIKNKQTSAASSTARIKFTSLVGSSDGWAAGLGIDIPDVVIKISNNKPAQQVSLDRLHGSIDASNQKIHAKLALVAPRGGATVHINATHVMKNNRGQAQYRLEPVDIQLHGAAFTDTYSDWPAKLLLNAGILGMVGELSWRQGEILPSQQTTLTMQNVSGAYGDITFAGLAGTLDAKGLNELRIKSRQALRMSSLNIGEPITDITLQTEMVLPKGGKPRAAVTDLAMNVLGGKMTGKRIEIDLARNQNPFTLQVSGVDVEKLLKLEQKQGLLGSGIIDGELPLVLSQDGLSMQDGQLAARKPGGKLRYRANEGVLNMAASNAGVQLLVTAMADFNYKVLEADVDYTPDGLLKMKVRLEGSNPELEGGRAVHLNVNVEDNILALLRSLRLADNISEKIGEQVQKRQSGKK